MNRTDRKEMIEHLGKTEALFINKLYKFKMKDLAGEAIENAISEFIKALERDCGMKIVPTLDLEYRTFVISLSKYIEEIYMDDAMPVILGVRIK